MGETVTVEVAHDREPGVWRVTYRNDDTAPDPNNRNLRPVDAWGNVMNDNVADGRQACQDSFAVETASGERLEVKGALGGCGLRSLLTQRGDTSRGDLLFCPHVLCPRQADGSQPFVQQAIDGIMADSLRSKPPEET